MKPQLLLVVLTLAFTLTGCAQPALSPMPESDLPFARELQDALDNGLEKYGGKGISAAVIVPGHPIWVGVSGVSHETKPITPDTLFSAGSITKNFTAATILQLAEEEVLTLDDPLHKWLPDYPNIDNTITIRQLLNHTSGIYNMTENPEYWNAVLASTARFWSPEDIITTFVLEPYFAKGTDWHYSNPSYILLRMIIVEATGSKISTEYRNRFWNPLGLTGMFLTPEETLPDNTAHGWWDTDGDGVYDEQPVLPIASFYSGLGGGVYSTAEDLAKWSQALYHEGRVLRPQSLDAMLTFHSPTPGEPLVAGYGLGAVRFSPELFNGMEVWGHGGNAPGYAAASLYLPDYGVSIGLATNTEEGEAMRTINDLLSILTSHLEAAP